MKKKKWFPGILISLMVLCVAAIPALAAENEQDAADVQAEQIVATYAETVQDADEDISPITASLKITALNVAYPCPVGSITASDYSWTSSNTKYVTVNAKGEITASAKYGGSNAITVTGTAKSQDEDSQDVIVTIKFGTLLKGICKDPTGQTSSSYYYKDGKVQNITYVTYVNGSWYNLVNGQVVGGTVAKNDNGWWYIGSSGKVDFGYNGFAKNSNGWWYVENGKVNFKHTVSVETSMSNQVLTLVNQERAKQGLSSLSMPAIYQTMATQRAFELVSYFSHTRPDGRACYTVYSDYGVTASYWGENIAWGQTSASSVMNSWMNSEGHRANILTSGYTTIGIACVKVDGICYWVQIFSGDYRY